MKIAAEDRGNLSKELHKLREDYEQADRRAREAYARYSKKEISYKDAKHFDKAAVELHKKWHKFLETYGHEFTHLN